MREEGDDWRRVVIEKPFGRDLESARRLNEELLATIAERQIYRIDHYLGKETVQNILVFRFGNGIFEPIWNRRYIDHVQITAAESVGVEQRGGYYDTSGALRDMIPNHLFQLVTLTAMEPPNSFAANVVRDEQAKILSAIQSFTPEDVLTRTVRGQYGDGTMRGGGVPAYRAEPSVPLVEAAWRIVGPIQDGWKALPPRSFPNDAAGAWGPAPADELLARDGRTWRDIPR
jgi:glucose-6-phosphate 1-dehydrogenase